MADTAPAVRSLHVDSRDNLWVGIEPGDESTLQGLFAVYDVFSPGGIFVQQVQLVGTVHREWDKWYFVADDRLVLVCNYRSSLAVNPGWSLADEPRPTGPEDSGAVVCFAMTKVP